MFDILFFSLINPTTSNSYVVILGCVLVILTVYALVLTATRLVAIFIPISAATQKRFTLFVSLLLVFMLLMQSIGQLSTRDLIAILPLLVVLYIYLAYIAKDKPQQP
jgi:Ca2+/Na+ antiporter